MLLTINVGIPTFESIKFGIIDCISRNPVYSAQLTNKYYEPFLIAKISAYISKLKSLNSAVLNELIYRIKAPSC